jgi:hypothetical protein
MDDDAARTLVVDPRDDDAPRVRAHSRGARSVETLHSLYLLESASRSRVVRASGASVRAL